MIIPTILYNIYKKMLPSISVVHKFINITIMTEHDCNASQMYLYNDNCSFKGLENYEDLLSHKLRG
jgi:hypothetical protein